MFVSKLIDLDRVKKQTRLLQSPQSHLLSAAGMSATHSKHSDQGSTMWSMRQTCTCTVLGNVACKVTISQLHTIVVD